MLDPTYRLLRGAESQEEGRNRRNHRVYEVFLANTSHTTVFLRSIESSISQLRSDVPRYNIKSKAEGETWFLFCSFSMFLRVLGGRVVFDGIATERRWLQKSRAGTQQNRFNACMKKTPNQHPPIIFLLHILHQQHKDIISRV